MPMCCRRKSVQVNPGVMQQDCSQILGLSLFRPIRIVYRTLSNSPYVLRSDGSPKRAVADPRGATGAIAPLETVWGGILSAIGAQTTNSNVDQKP